MKLMTIIMGALLLSSCASKKNSNTENDNATKKSEKQEVVKIKATTGEFAKVSDPIMSIDTAFVEGNSLFLDVAYGGGCEKHTFQVIGSIMIAKSMPPIRSLQLVHQANEDRCRAIVRERLEIDLREVAYQQEEGSEIYFSLEGWKDRIYYKYSSK